MPIIRPVKKISAVRKASREWFWPNAFLPNAIMITPIIVRVVPVPLEKGSDASRTPTIRSQSPVSVCWIPDLVAKSLVLDSFDSVGTIPDAIGLG